MATVLGQLATPGPPGLEGHLQHVDQAGNIELNFLPPIAFLRRQPAELPVLMYHDADWPVGGGRGGLYLERSQNDGLLAVASVRDDITDLLADGDWYLSAGVRTLSLGSWYLDRALLREVSLVRSTASVDARPLCWSRSRLEPQGMPLRWYSTWGRGIEAMGQGKYRRGDLEVVDLDPLDAVDEMVTAPSAAKRRAEAAPGPQPQSDPHLGHAHLDGRCLSPAVSDRVRGLLGAGLSVGAVRKAIEASA